MTVVCNSYHLCLLMPDLIRHLSSARGDAPEALSCATRGDKQATVGVYEWDSLAVTGEQEFNFTFKRQGVFCLGILATIGGNSTMFRLDIHSVA